MSLSDFQIPAEWLTGSGLAGMVAALYWGLYTGRLATGRELGEKNAEISENRQTIRELLDQNGALIQERTAAVAALDALRRVAGGETK